MAAEEKDALKAKIKAELKDQLITRMETEMKARVEAKALAMLPPVEAKSTVQLPSHSLLCILRFKWHRCYHETKTTMCERKLAEE